VPEESAGSASSFRGIRLTTGKKTQSGYPKSVSWARFVMSTWEPSAGNPVKSVDPSLSWGALGDFCQLSVSVSVCRVAVGGIPHII